MTEFAPAPVAIMPGLDPDRISTWIFDLDNTLYPASCQLFNQIDMRMSTFIARHFDLDFAAARRKQKAYFREYGTTLRGLMQEHHLDPVPFLEYVHDIDLSPVVANPTLATALSRLPGRKVIFTNGSRHHAERVLDRLEISAAFSAIFDIVCADYIPKPDPRAYDRLLKTLAIRPARACMVEDIARNLAPARAWGMTTVWLQGEPFGRPRDDEQAVWQAIDHVISDLPDWLTTLAHLPRRAAFPQRPGWQTGWPLPPGQNGCG